MENTKKTEANFIHNFIDEDIAEGRYADRPVCTRFPPEPNGYLHIGHAKSICLNFTTAEKYGGTCNLRFDDTNPVKEETEYVDSIKEDVEWLGFSWDGLFFASDYFEEMYACAIRLIEKDKAFVDDLSADEIRDMRGALTEPGRESPYRNRSAEENRKLFEEMRAGKYADGEKVLRAKIDMASPNINMRDPVIYRISRNKHHNTGDLWCVYPMYDFAHPLEDAIEGVTHSLCTLEFEDHRPLYDWVLETLEWPRPPRQIEFARLNLTNTVMSKRYLKELVDSGLTEGWDDPRMPTVAGLRRRGFTPAAIRDFCEQIGISKSNSTVDIEFLDHCVRNDLKSKTEMRNVVFDPIKAIIVNYPEEEREQVKMENNREAPDLGERTVPFGRELYIDGADFEETPPPKYFRLFPGNEVRLKGAYCITCEEVAKNEDGSVKALLCSYDPDTKSGSGFEGRKVKGTIHWVEASSAVPIIVREYERLMIADESGTETFNPDSVRERLCFAEPSVANAAPGERFQFFRHGYYVVDTEQTTDALAENGDAPREKTVFNRIVGLKSSWKKGSSA
ncbi:MAG: glutamine--tRNA ligase/YqeY domain fusion protein [Clostridiales Family XIII bacterium]|nr:glutamine--tRNA ligase/YqeY domain fusion protein [Clostridiales Family XIII bacterium]